LLKSSKTAPDETVTAPEKTTQSTYQNLDRRSFRDAQVASPSAKASFRIQGVLLASDFLPVNIADATILSIVKPAVFASLMDFFASGQPVCCLKVKKLQQHKTHKANQK
jgi:hypothetical protein